jgi:hypothetical protein
VDAVITAVEQLEDRPIEEHVGVFEAAHDRLRRALDDPDAGGPDRADDPADRADDPSDAAGRDA